MSDLEHITAEDIEVELELSAPYPVCYFLLFEGRTIGVLYWDDLTFESIGPMPGRTRGDPDPYGGWAPDDELGWAFFLSESPDTHDGLDRDVRLSKEVAIADARERVAKHVRETGREGLVAFEDLPWERRPWKMLPYPEQE